MSDSNNNTGNRNSGNWNSGYRNSGYWNSGSWNTGFFNSTTPDKVRAFNKDCTREDWDNAEKPSFIYNVSPEEWIPESKMTDEEKKENHKSNITDGYLKTIPMKDAWKKSWDSATEEDKEKLFKLPNFDADVFKEISGIDVSEPEKVIEIKGKKFSESTIIEALKNHTEGL